MCEHFFQVRDSGNLYDTSDFTIIVNDMNNNPPVFEFPNATTEIRLNIEVSSTNYVFLTITGTVLIMKLYERMQIKGILISFCYSSCVKMKIAYVCN
jgi:hypothetical protein